MLRVEFLSRFLKFSSLLTVSHSLVTLAPGSLQSCCRSHSGASHLDFLFLKPYVAVFQVLTLFGSAVFLTLSPSALIGLPMLEGFSIGT